MYCLALGAVPPSNILHLGHIFVTAGVVCAVLGIFDAELFCPFSLHVMQVSIVIVDNCLSFLV